MTSKYPTRATDIVPAYYYPFVEKKVNDENPCQLVYSPRVSLEGLHSGTHKITVNVVSSGSAVGTAGTAIYQDRSHLEKKDSSSAPQSKTHAQYAATVLRSDTILVDVVGPGWQGGEDIRKRQARSSPPSGVSHDIAGQGSSRTADVGGVSGGVGGKKDTFGGERLIPVAGSNTDCGDGIGILMGGYMDDGLDKAQAGKRLGRGLAGAGDGWYSRTNTDDPIQYHTAESEEKLSEHINVIRVAIVSNTLEDHSQNRAFAKLCAGLSASKWVYVPQQHDHDCTGCVLYVHTTILVSVSFATWLAGEIGHD